MSFDNQPDDDPHEEWRRHHIHELDQKLREANKLRKDSDKLCKRVDEQRIEKLEKRVKSLERIIVKARREHPRLGGDPIEVTAMLLNKKTNTCKPRSSGCVNWSKRHSSRGSVTV